MLLEFAERLAGSAARRHLLFAAATLFTVLFMGYHFGTFDQTIHIPFLKKYVDPSLYPGDAFFELRFQHYSFFWFFWQPLLRLGVLEWALFAGHLLATYATFWAVWALTQTLFASPLASLLATLALAFPHIGFAGFPIIEFSLLNRTFVLPFLLVALNLYLQRRVIAAFGLMGVLYNLHVISVQFVLAMCLFDALFAWRQIGWRRMLLALLVFLLGAAPVLAWKLGGSPVDFAPRPEWFSVVARGTLYNLFYLFPPYPHIVLMSLSGLSAIGLFGIARRHEPSPRHDATVTRFVIAGLIVLGVQIITAQWLPITIIVQSQIIRIGLFVMLLSYLYFAKYLADRYPGRKRGGWALLALAFVTLTLPIATLISWALLRLPGPARFRRAAAGVTFVAVWVATFVVAARYNVWGPGIHLYGPRTAWEDAQRWARDNTPREALFVTPPQIWWLYQSDWRVFSERSTLVTLTDLLEAAFMPEYLPIWQPRFEAVAPGALVQFAGDYFENKRLTAEAYYRLDEADLAGLADRYGADFAVLEQPHTLDLPLAFENDGYRIYRLER